MQKKGEGDTETIVLQWLMSLILAVLVIASLTVFIRHSALGVNFNKNFLARDTAIIIDTLYLSPSNAYVYYPINDVIYKFDIGKFKDKYKVKVSAKGDDFENEYNYAENGFKKEINANFGKGDNLQGLNFFRNSEGMTILDVNVNYEEGLIREQSVGDKILGRRGRYTSGELASKARELASKLDAEWPVHSDKKMVTDCYGSRSWKTKNENCGENHCGIDIRAMDENQNPLDIYSALAGIVTRTNNDMGMVEIKSGDVIITYLHLSEIEKNVAVGNIVRKGEKIGKAGNKGDSTAVHLHLSVSVSGIAFDPLDIRLFNPDEVYFKENSNCRSGERSYSVERTVS